ncbi:RNA polymerase sigma-70 factor [Arachidicoccus ginsenosidivorans]|uniref:RNA polymerase sigma-70 factor n=1 Tax=Arachidicoccus ginsenosidivorans TaxID=496057 RepID=UPI0013155B5A|nr:RNA polymerase sigma-70 factor [Arachidicoccus ginsenosidivorans]
MANDNIDQYIDMPQQTSSQAATFEQEFKMHYSFLCTIAYSIVEDQNASMDIVQEFFLYCWKKRDVIEITHTFKSYAVRAIRNASLNYIKKQNRVKLAQINDLELKADIADTEIDLNDEGKNAALWKAVGQLPEKRKQIFLLSNIEGLKYQEIADKQGVSINTVKTQIRLALQYLRTECSWMINCLLLIISIEFSILFTLF